MASREDIARERGLIEKLEFRIAAADTSGKLHTLLQKFLPALLLKLATDDADNRNLTIKVCQYIRQRLQIDESIQLPVEALSKTFRETSNVFVKQFTILFLQQSLNRLPLQDAIEALPAVLGASLQSGQHSSNEKKMFMTAIDLLLTVLCDWRPPKNGSPEDAAWSTRFALSEAQSDILAHTLASFLLFNPKTLPTAQDPDDKDTVFNKHLKHRSTIVPNLADFLYTSIFSDIQRFSGVVILSVDANAVANTRADTMFKQCNFDLEDHEYIDRAFHIYDVGSVKLRTKVVTLLSRSKNSTIDTSRLLHLVRSHLEETTANLEASKLRNAVFSYLLWAIRVNPAISAIALELVKNLRASIEAQGWPTPQQLSQLDTELRSQAYKCIGLLSATITQKSDSQSQAINQVDEHISTFDIVSWLFTSLRSDTTRHVKHSIEESLGHLMTSTRVTDGEEYSKYKALFLFNIAAVDGEADPIYHAPTRTNVQHATVRFANRILPFPDVEARMIDLLALASERREVVEEATRGLDPSWYNMTLKMSNGTSGQASSFPSFDTFAEAYFGLENLAAGSKSSLGHAASMSGAVVFFKHILVAEAWKGTSYELDFEHDWQANVNARLDNDSAARTLFRACLQAKSSSLIATLLQMCYRGMLQGSADCELVAFQITSVASNTILQALSVGAIADLRAATRTMSHERYRPCRILGTILSLTLDDAALNASTQVDLSHWRSAVGQEHVQLVSNLLTTAFVMSRAKLRHRDNVLNSDMFKLWQTCCEMLKSTNKSIVTVAATAVGQMALCGLHGPKDTILDSLDSLLGHAKKENETAIIAAGRVLYTSWHELNTSEQLEALDRIYALHEIRRAEFHFALGEALAVSALRFQSTSTITDFDIEGKMPADIHAGLFDRLLSDVLDQCRLTKPSLKRATCIWLLSLVQFCKLNDSIQPRLQEIQAAFLSFLSDRDDVVQEVGSRGVGIVYEKGDRHMREDLVRELVQSFTSTTAKTAGTVSEDTQLFEEGALPTEKGQSVSTYKDIVSLAQEMGDPSLVYRFMNLASSNAIWSSRAALGRFGLPSLLAESDYLQKNKSFYPKLYRYRFDPNPNVQRVMNDIWKGLVKDSNATVAENFDIIMDDLLKSIVSGREWRGREASCSAISELIQGGDVALFEKYLDETWKVAFKVLDDVKESVRAAAMKLCRTLTKMLIRNLEVGDGLTARAKVMLGHAIPFLIQQMEGGAGKEVQQYAIVTLLDIVKKAPPRSLKSYAPTLLSTLITSLSSLEHESINYLHLNADKYGVTAEKLDSLRVSSIGQSPLMEAIEKCLDTLSATPTVNGTGDATSRAQQELLPMADAMKRVERCFRTAIGLPSRVGLSRVIITLVTRHNTIFQPYSDRFARVLRKNLLDRNATVSQSFSTALAYLLRLASEKEVQETIRYTQTLYFDSKETGHRAVAAEVVLAVSKASNDIFKLFASSFLPFVFVGKQDRDNDTSSKFDEAWKENVAGSRSLRLYLEEIVRLISDHIKSTLWPVRHACCFAVSDLVSSGDQTNEYTKSEALLIWPVLEESLTGKTWEGKEKIITALPLFVAQAGAIWDEIRAQVRKIALREAKRNNLDYCPHALQALAATARLHNDLDMSKEVVPYLEDLANKTLDKTSDAMDIDEPSSKSVQTR